MNYLKKIKQLYNKKDAGFTTLEINSTLLVNKQGKPLTGFTLIELVIAIFILSIAIIGISNAFYIINILTSDSTDRLTATYLAQEGMEIVRNIRDTNWLNMDSYCMDHSDCFTTNIFLWDDHLTNCEDGCNADYKTAINFDLPAYNNSELDYLNIDNDGFYGYGTGTRTKFKRKITITEIPDNVGEPPYHIMKVSVDVSWDAKATILDPDGYAARDCVEGKNCMSVKETLYNWYFPNH